MMAKECNSTNIEFYCKADCIHNIEELCRLPLAKRPVFMGGQGVCTSYEEKKG